MAFRSFEVACEKEGCKREGVKTTTLLDVVSRLKLPSGTQVDEICRECGEKLMVQFSAPSINSTGGSEDRPRWCGGNVPDGHHIFLGPRTDQPMFEVCPSTNMAAVHEAVLHAEVRAASDPEGREAN